MSSSDTPDSPQPPPSTPSASSSPKGPPPPETSRQPGPPPPESSRQPGPPPPESSRQPGPPPPESSRQPGPPPPESSRQPGPPPPESSRQPGPPPPESSRSASQIDRSNANPADTNPEVDGERLTAEAEQLTTNQNIFLWGKTRAGKTSLIAAFHKASIVSHETGINFIAKDERTREFISGVNRKILADLQAVEGTQTVDEPQTFIVRDLVNDWAIELSVPDGPGGAMFAGQAGGQVNEMMRREAMKLNEYARVSDQIVFCVSSIEKDQNYYGVDFVKKISEIINEETRTLSCSRFIIVLTKVDLLAAHASDELSQKLGGLMSPDIAQYVDQQQDSGVTPLTVMDWIDPIEMAKAIIGPYALNQLMSYLKPDAELVVALCSAWGFDPDSGYPIANAQGAFNIEHLSMDSDESELDFWRPYGVNSVLEYMLRGTHSMNLQPITRADLADDLVDQGGRI